MPDEFDEDEIDDETPDGGGPEEWNKMTIFVLANGDLGIGFNADGHGTVVALMTRHEAFDMLESFVSCLKLSLDIMGSPSGMVMEGGRA